MNGREIIRGKKGKSGKKRYLPLLPLLPPCRPTFDKKTRSGTPYFGLDQPVGALDRRKEIFG
jgi:hypothetical protein